MKRMKNVTLAALASAPLAIAVLSAQQLIAPTAPVSRYSGTASVPAREGAAASPFHIEVKDWNIGRYNDGKELPLKGFLIATLKWGTVETEIAGKKDTRNAGDLWIVDTGQSMTVSLPPRSEAAQIETITIAAGAGKH